MARMTPARDLEGFTIHEASTFAARACGLALRRALPAGHALHLTGTRAVHTVGMRFALDLVWLDAAGAVARIDPGVRPWRHRACRAARSVVECRAGEGDALAAALARARTAPLAGLDAVAILAPVDRASHQPPQRLTRGRTT
jgi:uncharacterized membrane protein (UPF0127 family)